MGRSLPSGLTRGAGAGRRSVFVAILEEHLGDVDAALNLYQDFKWACIAQIRGANWSLSSEEIDSSLARLSEQQEDTQPPAGPFPF